MHYSVEETKKLIIFVILAKLMSSHRASGFIANISRPIACQGSTATIDFDFNLQGESIVSGSKVWFFNRIPVAEDTGSGFTALTNYTSRLTSHLSHGMTLSSVTTADSGTYEYEILLVTGFTPKTATASLTVYIGPLPPSSPSGCSVSTSQSGSTVTCTISGNCGTPPLTPSWVNFTTRSNQFECTVKGTYQCCATSVASTSCYSGSPNDFCILFDCAGGNCKSILELALGDGLGNDTICIICLICIVILVKIVDIHAKDKLQKPKPRGSDVTITASVCGFCKSSVKWTGPHGKIKAIKGKYDKEYNRKTGLRTLKISNLEINDSGLYTCHAKSSCGSLAQDSVRISVYEQLAVDIDIGETFRQHGSDVKIICSVYGSKKKSVTWTGSKENILTTDGSYTIAPYDSNTDKSSLTIRTSTRTEDYICQVAFKDSGVSVKIYIKITVIDNGSLRVTIEKIVLFAPASENESREWIGLQGETLTDTAKYDIMSFDSNTNESHLTIKNFSVNDNGCYTCQPKNSSNSKNSIRVSINDATDYKKGASKLILGLCFGIICVSSIACIVILVVIGEQCALKFGLGLGLGLGIPFVGCIIVVILVKKVLKPQTPPPETRKTKSGSRSEVSRRDVQIQMEEKHVKGDEERPPAIHIGTQNKVESKTTSKKTSDRPQPSPPVTVVSEDIPKHRPQPPPPENSDVNDPNKRGLSANFDDKQGLPTGTPGPIRLTPLPKKQATVEEKDASREKPKKKQKNKKKDQMNEGNPEEQMVESTSKRTLPEMPEDKSDGN